MVLALLWLASIFVAVVLTDMIRQDSASGEHLADAPAGAGLHQHSGERLDGGQDRERSSEPRGSRQPLGEHYIVLESVNRYSAQAEAEFRRRQDSHNRQVEERGTIPPWFGVRRPASGGLQYIYGMTEEGLIGIPKNDQTLRYLELLRHRFPDAAFRP